MALPNFLCVGAQKAATTTFYKILGQHPDICLPSVKEVHFFDDDDNFGKGLFWYENVFQCNGEKVIGEITPEYMYFDYVPERIHKTLGGDVKLIFILRNPADRAYSHYSMERARGIETKGFEKAVALEPERIKKGYFEQMHYSYISRGLYATQIKRFLERFAAENMLFLIFENDWLENREKTFKRVFEFLGIRHMALDLNFHAFATRIPRLGILRRLYHSRTIHGYFNHVPRGVKNIIAGIAARKPGKLNAATRNMLLRNYFMDEIVELQRIIGRPLNDAWR